MSSHPSFLAANPNFRANLTFLNQTIHCTWTQKPPVKLTPDHSDGRRAQSLTTTVSLSSHEYSLPDLTQWNPAVLDKPRQNAGSGKLAKILGDEYADKVAKDSQPWYLRPTYDPSEIMIDPDGTIRGGTLTALVERLTAHDQLGQYLLVFTFLDSESHLQTIPIPKRF